VQAGGFEQFEIQLGHLCNDRCVFCASGQLTQRGQAPLLAAAMLAQEIRDARARGARRIIFVGGEPTIQPAFLEMVQLAVTLGFERIVIFTNGSKPARTDLIDRVIATGGNFEWRFSFHGATREAHERTTRRKGSFDQVHRSLARVTERGQRATINMCVCRQNYESIEGFAELLRPFGVAALHVDMLNPYDVGDLSRDELADIMPRYGDLARPLERMVRALPDGFDVNIGNLPFCVAPTLAPWIHHGGNATWTVRAADDGGSSLQSGRSLFVMKSEHKKKPATCGECVFDRRCGGVFGRYADRFGSDELQPITPERAAALDPDRRLVALHLRPWLESALIGVAPWAARISVEEPGLRVSRVTFDGDDGRRLRLELTASDGDRTAASEWFGARGPRPRQWAHNAIATSDWFGVRVLESTVEAALATSTVAALWQRLELAGATTVVPPGEDAFAGALHPSIRERLGRLRVFAPFGVLRWTATRVSDGGERAEIELRGPEGEVAVVWLAWRDGRPSSGYRVEPAAPRPPIVESLRALLTALGFRTTPSSPDVARR